MKYSNDARTVRGKSKSQVVFWEVETRGRGNLSLHSHPLSSSMPLAEGPKWGAHISRESEYQAGIASARQNISLWYRDSLES